MMHQRILVATDLDPVSAVDLAASIEPCLGPATALALGTVRNEREGLASGEVPSAREVEEALERWSSTFLVGHPRELIVETCRRPTDGITQLAERWNADLVVLSASEKAGFWRSIAGSVSDRVVRRAGADVLVARASPRSGVVLAASDLSDPSFHAVAAAATEARDREGSLVVLHVIDGRSPPLGVRTGATSDVERRASACAWLEHAMAKIGARGEVVVREGSAVAEIVAHAVTRSAELVIVASHGRTGVASFVFGSVAEALTREAPCSVLVVRR